MATSARKENRWRRACQQENDADGDRRRELEAAFMPRGPRQDTPAPTPRTTRRQAIAWMLANAHEYGSATALAEGANAALDLRDALDDEMHWIWDEALIAFGHA